MNKIVPGAIKKFKQKGPAFLLMENIQARSHLRLDFGFQEYNFFFRQSVTINQWYFDAKIVLTYSHLSNNRGGWNKRVGVQKSQN